MTVRASDRGYYPAAAAGVSANPVDLVYVVQSEMLTGGVIESQVVSALRGRRKMVGAASSHLVFLEPARMTLRRQTRRTLAAFRGAWPGGEIGLVPFISRLGGTPGAAPLARYVGRRGLRNIVFHCRGPVATCSAHAARARLGSGRVVFDLRGASPYEAIHRHGFNWPVDLPPQAQRAYDVALECDRHAAALADSVVTVSEGMRDYVVDELGVEWSRVVVIPSCIEELAYSDDARRTARARWGVPHDAPVLLYSGRLGAERLPGHMFDVVARLRRIHPETRLVIMSYRTDIDDLGAELERSGLPRAAVVVEQHSRDAALESACGADVGVIFLESAKRFEGIQAPIKIAEYLAAGLSLLVNRSVGRIPELVRDSGVGWVVDHDQPSADIDACVARVADEIAHRRDALRRASLAVCEERYLWRCHTDALRRAYGIAESESANG